MSSRKVRILIITIALFSFVCVFFIQDRAKYFDFLAHIFAVLGAIFAFSSVKEKYSNTNTKLVKIIREIVHDDNQLMIFLVTLSIISKIFSLF